MNKLTDEIKVYWRQSPLWGKVAWLVAIFLSSGSIASLSDTVFAWKGFILEGLNFYYQVIQPVNKVLSRLFSIKLSEADTHLTILFGLLFSNYSRFKIRTLLNQRKDVPRTFWLYFRAVFIHLIISLSTTLFVSYGLVSDAGYIYIFSIWALFIFSAVYPIWVIQTVMLFLPDIEKYQPTYKDRALAMYEQRYSLLYIPYYAPILIAITFVFVLAAINQGLTKPISP